MSTPAVVPPTPQPEPEVVEFTPAQQAKLDEIIKKAMGRAGSEARAEAAELKTKLAKVEADLVEAKKALDKAKTPAERKEASEEVADLKAQIEEMKSARTQTVAETEGLRKQLQDSKTEGDKARAEALHQKKLFKITTAAAKEDFVNIDVVMTLTEKYIKWNEQENKWVVLNEDGQPRMNPAYDPMTVEEFYADYASKHPYLVKGQTKPGTGSTGSNGSTYTTGRYKPEEIFGPKSDSKRANELAIKNPLEYKRLKAEARERGLIA